jgi:hypothetical protein
MENNKLFESLKSKSITESSLKLYFNNLRRLNGGDFPKSFTFLKDVDAIVSKLADYKPNTRRTYLISIVSLLKTEPKQKKLYDKYYALMDGYNKSLATNNEKSETQKENWLSQEAVKKVESDLTAEVAPLLEQKKLGTDAYNKLLSWVVLSLYTTQPPRRNLDYQMAVVCNKYLPDLDPHFNYLELPTGTWYFGNYKTKGTYKIQEIKCSDECLAVIKKYLKFHPLKAELKKKTGAVPLLVDATGAPFEAVNAITRILNKVFGRRIGVSLLRNIYLTDKYSGKVAELNADATQMGTSASTIQNQYIKMDGVTPTHVPVGGGLEMQITEF